MPAGLMARVIFGAFAIVGIAAGSEELHFPSPESQAATFTPYEDLAIGGTPVRRFLRDRKVVLFTDVKKITEVPGGGFSVLNDYVACAVPLSADGYLLTVSHAIHDPVYALVADHERPHLIKAAIVWDGHEAHGCDLAILKIAWTPHATATWAASAGIAMTDAVLSSGAYLDDRGPDQRCRLDDGAGTISKTPVRIGPDGIPPFELIEARLLVHPGDSGGPVVSLSGALVGVTLGHILDHLGQSTGVTVIIRPDLAWLDRVIAQHRAEQAASP
ncbi:MAG: trypsin-like peptidase domain-containing protein [Planctomycetes bacterium]|nr:trypsin-like peptidase domain-containing protein [Planctomycetota bacterium]